MSHRAGIYDQQTPPRHASAGRARDGTHVGPRNGSAWAFGFNQRFDSVSSVFQNFGFQKMTSDRFAKIPKTDQFWFGFLVPFFG